MTMTSTNSGNNGGNPLTIEQVMQHIEQSRRENDVIRAQSENERAQWRAKNDRRQEETEAENERMRKESLEARKRLKESLRQQEELRKSNDELRTWLHNRGDVQDQLMVRRSSDVEEGHPFANGIMEESIPPYFIVSKVLPFTGEGDPKAHLKAFRAQMLISGGNGAIRCKMFVGNLIGTALKWFGKIPTASITSFSSFSKIFLVRFVVNRPKQLQLADMFDVKQCPKETLKQFLNRLCDVSMGLVNPSEEMLVGAFVKGMRATLFSESLIRSPAATLT